MIPRLAVIALLLGSAGCSSDLKYINTNKRTEAAWRVLTQSDLAARAGGGQSKPPPTEVPVRQIEIRGTYVAVFDIQDKSGKLERSELDGLTDYLASKLAEGGLFHVVPRAEIKKRLTSQKKASHKECYDQSCQIEIGREIAAQKTLSVSISPIGSSCIITAALFDLKKAATDATATSRGKCTSDAFLAQVEEVIGKFRRMAK